MKSKKKKKKKKYATSYPESGINTDNMTSHCKMDKESMYSNVFKHSFMIDVFNANLVMKHDFLMHLHLLSLSENVEILTFALVFNFYIGAQKIIMHSKSC